jgi:hypothetical protein
LDRGCNDESYQMVLECKEEPVLVLVSSGARLKKRVVKLVELKKRVVRPIRLNKKVVRSVERKKHVVRPVRILSR